MGPVMVMSLRCFVENVTVEFAPPLRASRQDVLILTIFNLLQTANGVHCLFEACLELRWRNLVIGSPGHGIVLGGVSIQSGDEVCHGRSRVSGAVLLHEVTQ